MSKKLFALFGLLALISISAHSQSSAHKTRKSIIKHPQMQPIIIQGALPIETEHMAAQLDDLKLESVAGWTFWSGHYHGYPVIISKTRMGMSNAAAATAIAIEKYHPLAIINQGTAGGHDPQLHSYDIVLGSFTVNIGAFRTPKQASGAGSNALSWIDAFDVLPDNEADPEPIAIRRFAADAKLMQAAQQVKGQYRLGKVVQGGIGSADVWNNELDRIAFFHQHYGTVAEEMEAASVAQIASQFQLPFLAIRVLSNNLTNDDGYQAGTAQACQNYALAVALAYMRSQDTPNP
jgi:adenosylhomocysteine nucleosidase